MTAELAAVNPVTGEICADGDSSDVSHTQNSATVNMNAVANGMLCLVDLYFDFCKTILIVFLFCMCVN